MIVKQEDFKSKPKIKWTRGKELAARRKMLGLNVRQMVDLLRRIPALKGTTWGTLARWEKGLVIPRAPYEEKLFEALDHAEAESRKKS